MTTMREYRGLQVGDTAYDRESRERVIICSLRRVPGGVVADVELPLGWARHTTLRAWTINAAHLIGCN